MSTAEVVSDLIELERLAEEESDSERRKTLVGIHDNLAARSGGAKVAEVARLLDVSLPTVRAWIDAGVLDEIPDKTPRRVTFESLAAVKRALDEIRAHADDRPLLMYVMRILRDRAALEGSQEGFEDYRAGRVTRLTPDLLDEIDQARRGGPRRRGPRPRDLLISSPSLDPARGERPC
jgi:hypothetical protein